MYQKQKKNQDPQYQNMNPFKEEEKRYKYYQNKQTDFSQLIDVKQLSDEQLIAKGIERQQNLYTFKFPNGVFLIKQFLSLEEQINICKHCMNEYIHQPYRTNLFIYPPEENFEKSTIKDDNLYHFNNKIRWANVGEQYDWNNRQYPKDKTEVPHPIQNIAQRANTLLKLQDQYQSEAVIINFYSETDYMTGHLDDAEHDQTSPIYSFSFGLSCVFVIGAPTKDVRPIALRLDSGDLLVMSGEARRAYHGVPRIISGSMNPINPYQQCKLENNKNTDFHVYNYLTTHRININTRQVYLK